MRISWNGSVEAQRQADAAYQKLKPKNKKRARKAAKRKTLTPKDYPAYIASQQWRRKRNRFVAKRKHRCETCGSQGPLHVHHKHYRTLGRETLSDVQVLCAGCHALRHEKDGVRPVDELHSAFIATL